MINSTFFYRKRGFCVLEYSVLFVIIAAALFICFNFLKRGLQGRFRANAEVFSSRQYAPGETVIIGQ